MYFNHRNNNATMLKLKVFNWPENLMKTTEPLWFVCVVPTLTIDDDADDDVCVCVPVCSYAVTV